MYYEYDYASCAFAWLETGRLLLFKMRKQETKTIEFWTLPAMESKHMCEKMAMFLARGVDCMTGFEEQRILSEHFSWKKISSASSEISVNLA